MPLIYESPDKGKTVYAREFGHLPGSTIAKNTAVYESQALQANEVKLWHDIQRAAETDPDLRELLDQAIMLYQLKRDTEETHA